MTVSEFVPIYSTDSDISFFVFLFPIATVLVLLTMADNVAEHISSMLIWMCLGGGGVEDEDR